MPDVTAAMTAAAWDAAADATSLLADHLTAHADHLRRDAARYRAIGTEFNKTAATLIRPVPTPPASDDRDPLTVAATGESRTPSRAGPTTHARIMDLLGQDPTRGWRPRDVAKQLTSVSPAHIRTVMSRAARAGQLINNGGYYRAPTPGLTAVIGAPTTGDRQAAM